MPLLLRYVLEACGTLVEARAAHNDCPCRFRTSSWSTGKAGRARRHQPGPAGAASNHQKRVEWPEHAWLTRRVARALGLRAGGAA
jgi:hypothetical protein